MRLESRRAGSNNVGNQGGNAVEFDTMDSIWKDHGGRSGRVQNRRFVRGAATVAICLALCCGFGAAAEDAAISFVHRQRSLQPGEVILVEARSRQPLKRLKIKVFQREFPAYGAEGGRVWTGLVGIGLETRPGSHPIVLTGESLAGKTLAARKVLKVLSKKFAARELAVEPKYVTPPPEVARRIEEESKRVNAIFAVVTPERYWGGSFGRPVPGEVISTFGKRSVFNRQPRSPHSGVDFRGAVGTPIRSPNGGRVVLASDLYFSGNTVILDHGLGLFSYFGHLSEISVKEGERVAANTLLGKVGATGRVTGPHLHWTVRLAGVRVDPLSLIHVLRDSD